jgi:hypothetical protein
MEKETRELPQSQRGFEVQDRKPVSESEYLLASFNALRTDVQNQLAALSKQVSEISIYVVERKATEKAVDIAAEIKSLVAETRAIDKRFMALERLHELPARLDATNARIDKESERIQALETARKTDAATSTGKKSMADKAVAFTAYVAAILGIVHMIIDFWGK